jgi:membrane-associated phospholipid phosphatase
VAFLYLSVTLVLVVAGRGRVDHRGIWVGVDLALLAGVALLRFLPDPRRPALGLLRETYGLWLMPAAYHSLSTLNRIPHDRYFDEVVLGWDRAIFGTHLHEWLGTRLPWPPLSEFLHLVYLGWVLLVPILVFTFFFQKRFAALRVFVTTQMLTMYGCYLVFIFFPVQGPWYTPPHPAVADHAVFARLVHAMLEGSAARGAAFPSSHVAGAVSVALVAFRFSRRLSYALGVIALSTVVATVYGGFHYAIDAVAGLVFGVVIGLAGPRVHAAISRRIRGEVLPPGGERESR